MINLLAIDVNTIVTSVGFIGSAFVFSLAGLKMWREYLASELEKHRLSEKAKVDIAREQSVGAEAIKHLTQAKDEMEGRIEALERELETGFDMADKERKEIKERLEQLKKEHSDFINKSLDYFMGRNLK